MQCCLSSKQIYSVMTFYSNINWTASIGIDVKYCRIGSITTGRSI